MLMVKEPWPKKPERSESARSTAGCRIELIPMPESVPSLSPVKIPRPESLRTRLLPKFVTCSVQSVTPAQSARRPDCARCDQQTTGALPWMFFS